MKTLHWAQILWLKTDYTEINSPIAMTKYIYILGHRYLLMSGWDPTLLKKKYVQITSIIALFGFYGSSTNGYTKPNSDEHCSFLKKKIIAPALETNLVEKPFLTP